MAEPPREADRLEPVDWLLVAGFAAAGVALGLWKGFEDWGPYHGAGVAWLAGEPLYPPRDPTQVWHPYLGPPWLAPVLAGLAAFLGPTPSYVLVGTAGLALAMANAGNRIGRLFVGGCLLLAMGWGQITPLLVGLVLLGVRTGGVAPLFLAVIIKPSVLVPVGALMLTRKDRPLLWTGLLGASTGVLMLGPWSAAWQSALDAIDFREAMRFQMGAMIWGKPAFAAMWALSWAVAWGSGHPAVAWLFGTLATPWMFVYDALGFLGVEGVLLNRPHPDRLGLAEQEQPPGGA